MLKRARYIMLFAGIVLLTGSCQYFQEDAPEEYLARVGDTYLLEEDLAQSESSPALDSDEREEYIRTWVMNNLLVSQAEKNLDADELASIEQLVDRYRYDLYSQAYLREMTKQKLDTLIDSTSIFEYYKTREEQYILNEDLVKLRYVAIDDKYDHIKDLKKQFREFDESAKYYLDSLSLTFNSYFLNDSIWIRKSDAFEKVKPLTANNENRYLRPDAYFELNDSTGTYLVKIQDVLERGEQAPLSYVQPIISQILLNKRKLDFIARTKKDLIEDAIERNKAEIRQ